MKHITLTLALTLVFAGGAALPTTVSAAGEDYAEAMSSLAQQENYSSIALAYAGSNKAAATKVRKAFLKAKKAFHEARQEIQAIKKGDETPAEEVPCFFCEDDGDGSDDGDQVEEGPELQG